MFAFFQGKVEGFQSFAIDLCPKGRKCDNEMWSMAGYFQIIKDVKIGSRWIKFNVSHQSMIAYEFVELIYKP